jgi:hypothetical protein
MTQRTFPLPVLLTLALLFSVTELISLARLHELRKEQDRAYRLYDQIEYGMSRTDVEKILGYPHHVSGDGEYWCADFDVGDYVIIVSNSPEKPNPLSETLPGFQKRICKPRPPRANLIREARRILKSIGL